MQVTQDKKRYPLLNHYRYTFHKLKEKSGGGALAVCAGDVMLSVLLPFLEAALAGAVAACLVSGRRPGEILALVAGYIVLLQVVRFLQSHFRELRTKALFLFRCSFSELDRKTLYMDGQSLESARGQKKRQAAMRNIYSGNEQGLEAFAAGFLNMIIQFAGLLIYGAIVGRYSLLLLALLLLQAVVTA